MTTTRGQLDPEELALWRASLAFAVGCTILVAALIAAIWVAL